MPSFDHKTRVYLFGTEYQTNRKETMFNDPENGQTSENLVVRVDDDDGKPERDRPRREIRCFDTNTKRFAWIGAALVVLILVISLLASSLKSLESTEYGLQYNKRQKTLADAAKSGGLHIGPPGYEFIKFPSTYISADLADGTCVSKDGLQVGFSVTFQYQLPTEWIIPVVIKYRNFNKWADVVEGAGTSAVHHACSEFQVANFQNQRGVIQSTMESNLRLKLEGAEGEGHDGVYARAISLQLRNVDLPEEYRQAVHEKQSAAEEIELAKNQRTQETTKAQTELLSAQEEARKVRWAPLRSVFATKPRSHLALILYSFCRYRQIMDTATNEVELLITEARLKANETIFSYEKEAETLVRVKESLNLTTDGVLSYMANKLYARAPHLKVSAAEPALLSRKEELRDT